MKKALICGVSGQNGAYVAPLFFNQGYEVWGTHGMSSFRNLDLLGIKEQVKLVSMSLTDFAVFFKFCRDRSLMKFIT